MLKSIILNLAGAAAAVGLASLPALFTLAPALTIPGVSATEDFGLTDISVRGVASIAATDTVSMELTPKANEPTFTTGYGQVTVTSNTKNGYYVYISTDDNSLTYSGHESSQDVDTIPSSLAGSAMSAPSWGYVVGTKCGQSGATNCVSQTQNNAADLALTYSKVPGTEGAPLVERNPGDPEADAKGETIYVGYGFKAAANQSVGVYSRKVTYTGLAKKASGTLVVNPNGGTWTHDGTAYPSASSFTKDEGTEMTIEAPSSNAYYTISYNANNQGATYSTTDANTKAVRNFEGWNVTAATGGATSGAYNSSTKVYLFGDGNDTATASYASSATFKLPTITKTGHTCQWAKGSVSGSKVDGNTNQSATADATYYAVCTPFISGTVSLSGSSITFNPTGLTGIPYGNTKSVTITPSSGYYFSAQPSCTDGFSASSITTGFSATGAQTVSITYTGNSGVTGTCTFTVSPKTYMQGWTGCSGLSEGNTVTLFDKRNDEPYTVAKINNQCWMTKNLKIAGKTLTSVDSDVASSFFLPDSTSPGFSSDNIDIAKVTIDTTRDANNNEYGGYYNWYAATAGTGTSSTSPGQTASSSICPKGWKLPTDSQFSSLVSAVGATANFTESPLNGALAGYYIDSSRSNEELNGYLWSSTSYGASNAIHLRLDYSGASMRNISRRAGDSVRCVFGS